MKRLKEAAVLFAAIAVIFSISGVIIRQVKFASAATAALTSRGVMFYGDTTNAGVMKARLFSGTNTWATEISGISGSASNILHVVAKTAPTREEMMIGSLRVNGTLQVETCTTECNVNGDFANRWSHAFVTPTQDCDATPTFGTCEQNFDIGYLALNGQALVVYGGDGADGGTVTDADTFYYALWNGSSWSPNATPGTPDVSNAVSLPGTAGTPEWIRVIPAGDNLADDRSNRAMVLILDTNADLFAFYWDGTSFDSGTVITTTLENRDRSRAFDGNWQGNNVFVLSYAETEGSAVNDIEYNVFTVGSGWAGGAQAYTTASSVMWIQSVADPTSSRIIATNNTSAADYRAAVWRGDDATNGWTVCSAGSACPDTSIETVGGMQAASAFERFGGQGLTLYNDQANNGDTPSILTYTAPSTWTDLGEFGVATADDTQSVKAWTDPNSDDIMIAQSDVDCDLNVQNWNGSSLDGAVNDIEVELSYYNAACTQNTPEPSGGSGYGYDFTWKVYSPWQRNWRFYDGADTASTPATGLANENTAPTGISDGQDLRLRINYAERSRSINNTDARKKLQYTSGCNPNTTLESDCIWTDVDDTGGAGIWRYVDLTCTATDCADNTTLVGTVLSGTSTCTAGLGCGTWVLDKDSATVSNMDHTAQATADTVQESEWIIEPNGPLSNTVYYFRIYNLDLDTPIYREQDGNDCQPSGTSACSYPSLETGVIGPSVDQVMRHGNWFSGGVEQRFFWAD